jgi:hypothetical protein
LNAPVVLDILLILGLSLFWLMYSLVDSGVEIFIGNKHTEVNKNTSDRRGEYMPILVPGTSQAPKEKLGSGVDSLNHTTKRLLTFHKKRFHDLTSFEYMYTHSVVDPNAIDNERKAQLLKAYGDLIDHYNKLIDEENLISRMERKAQIRNTIFRGITTLVIGFSIMLVYAMAAKWGIAMPLLRFGA